MTQEQLLKQLIEFFRDSFNEDPIGVGDWCIQGDFSADDIFDAIKSAEAATGPSAS